MQKKPGNLWIDPEMSDLVFYQIITLLNLTELSVILRKMQGVALKLGQFISMQDERDMVSKELISALESVRQHAEIMPEPKLIALIEQELGSNWEEK